MTGGFKEPVYVTRPLLPDLEKFKLRLNKIWESKWLSNMGEQHRLFEESARKALKAPYVSLFNNGTTALMAAVRFLGLKGEVITTPFTFPATPHALLLNGVHPVFCDIENETMNIDPDKIEAAITSKTTGILAVHIFGTPCDTVKIQKIADKHGLKVIYDAAHAFNTEIDGVGIGNFGDISMFSFHATKLFNTGEGGCLTYKDGCFKPGIELLRNMGIKNEEEVITAGFNGKMTEIQAALGMLNLELIEEERGKRSRLQEIYHRELSGVEGVACYKNPENIKESLQYFTVRIDEKQFGSSRDSVYEEFKKYNVFTRKYFYPLCSEYPCYKDYPSAEKELLPSAHKAADEVLCLPFYGELTNEDVEKICGILKGLKK
ncbi:MAG: DegT/DnrJ/EryC1/StrS family aminotransferase [Candidatus Goldbacteria bacterium]|nr:DegT/DnrJ/EryC1/StrS family aminotransferase [Candidatus Goldiibacteriota bacterium]